MGYGISQHKAKFYIAKADVPKALLALQHLIAGGGYSWINTATVLDAQDFREAMDECRWGVEFDARGNVNHIDFGGENAGDDWEIFKALAPFVRKDSYIEMVGEDGERWRWFFTGKTCKEQRAKISYGR